MGHLWIVIGEKKPRSWNLGFECMLKIFSFTLWATEVCHGLLNSKEACMEISNMILTIVWRKTGKQATSLKAVRFPHTKNSEISQSVLLYIFIDSFYINQMSHRVIYHGVKRR